MNGRGDSQERGDGGRDMVPLLLRHWFHPWVRKIPRGRNGNPLPHPCLENPMDRGAWRAAVPGVTESRMRLSHYAAVVGLPEQARPHPLTADRVGEGRLLPEAFHGCPEVPGNKAELPRRPQGPNLHRSRALPSHPSAWPPNSLSGFLAVSHQTPSSTCYRAFAQAVSPSCNTDESLSLQMTDQTLPS
ncbi:unnamed protein product [Rangifer tarandus platyrhynchus]|uniref:Uncharacterized protein n=1 Tax=Rangifer tarandus platyrhynchus TaxID=3082113 RepID=A0AC59Z631_RANTA